MLARRSLFVIGGASLLHLACGKPEVPESCPEAALSPAAKKLRDSLKYVNRGPDKAKFCDVCVQYKPGASGACGTCSLFEGPIHPQGTCAAFAPRG